jgi:hypothetical protein
MTSSSGSTADVKITSISPVEKPVSGIDIDINRSEFAKFNLQNLQVPAGIERRNDILTYQ